MAHAKNVGVRRFGLMLAIAASAHVATATVTPPWSEGFGSFSTGFLNGQGPWADPYNYFAVQTAVSRSSTKAVKFDTALIDTYGIPFANKWGYRSQEALADDVSYTPSGSDNRVVILSGYVKSVTQGSNQRPASAGIDLRDATNTIIGGIGLGTDNVINLAAGGFSSVDVLYSTTTYTPSDWNKISILVDLSSRALAFAINDQIAAAGGTTLDEIGGIALQAVGGATASVPFNANQPLLYWDDLSLTTRAHCEADFNLDQVVDDFDYVIFEAQYSALDCNDASMPFACSADLNADGLVDDDDFIIFSDRYLDGTCP